MYLMNLQVLANFLLLKKLWRLCKRKRKRGDTNWQANSWIDLFTYCFSFTVLKFYNIICRWWQLSWLQLDSLFPCAFCCLWKRTLITKLPSLSGTNGLGTQIYIWWVYINRTRSNNTNSCILQSFSTRKVINYFKSFARSWQLYLYVWCTKLNLGRNKLTVLWFLFPCSRELHCSFAVEWQLSFHSHTCHFTL